MRFKSIVAVMFLLLTFAACTGRTMEVQPTPGTGREPSQSSKQQETDDVEERAESQSNETGEGAQLRNTGNPAPLTVLPTVDPLQVQGNIATAGSSTVFPLSEAIAARFQVEGYEGIITVDSVGTGGGFERFCAAGETDIANASRPINASEAKSCQAIGREPVEFHVGTDALAVVVSQENDFAQDLTMDELALIFSTAQTWSDVRPEWPNEPIQRYIPGTDSGTFDYFVEAIFDEEEEPILSASNVEMNEDDNILVQGVLGSPYAIGFFGYAYYAENQSALQILSINGIAPNAESVDSGEYPLARPLFIYSAADIIQQKPQVAAFINFYLTYVNEEINDVGYFPASEQALNVAKQKLLDAISQ